MKKHLSVIPLTSALLTTSLASAPAVAAHTPQEAFFEQLRTLCGRAFAGEIVENTPAGGSFEGKRLIMHVRRCSDKQLHIPFHVGDDASRTWIITRNDAGLVLKHDHRHQDGSNDVLTNYGGHTVSSGWPQVQDFPADTETQDLFVAQGIPQSNGNTWSIYLYPDRFSYRMSRDGRVFQVDFDLTTSVKPPAAPWGHEDH
ncbi:hypothetical protein LJ739_11375 [Aestuariibacter halophilus]|uniref:Secreted protein n=1 Tax=Fluctibacter halophilus TaxID=226011 RepID=A0ABS8G8J8_9ALTE|nr:hypothetical protein [Aestuariibacter halophilus]MCC2616843.1 hypothetical protein [Aestuariibacter halophilus]